jgi:hypothetical protein
MQSVRGGFGQRKDDLWMREIHLRWLSSSSVFRGVSNCCSFEIETGQFDVDEIHVSSLEFLIGTMRDLC